MPESRGHRGPLLALFLLAAAGVGAASFLLLTGTALGNSTPAYSSLRTDPSGASVLFGAYARAGLRVVRGYDADSLGSMPPATTVAFVLAPEAWANQLPAQLEAFARRGGWVVLAAPPLPLPVPAPGSAEALEQTPPEKGLEQRLGAALVVAKPAGKLAAATTAAAMSAAPAGAQSLPLLHPDLTLKLSPAWTPLYQRGGRTYMAMRSVGQGRVVLATEATFLSNDNLARMPDAALLSWFAQGRSAVWVDETLHNMEEVRGVAWLLRRYRLGAAVLGLLATLGLLAWSVGARLERPPEAPPGAGEEAVIESAAAGYARLLERAIPLAEVLERCRRQWALRHPREAAGAAPWQEEGAAGTDEILSYYQRAWRRVHKP